MLDQASANFVAQLAGSGVPPMDELTPTVRHLDVDRRRRRLRRPLRAAPLREAWV